MEFKSVFKSYKLKNEEIKVLKNINLSIEEEDFLTIMGPSGSGKSTLLYLMGTLEKADSGEIIYNNLSIIDKDDNFLSELRRKKIGFIFQAYNLMPNLTVLENVLLPIVLDNKKCSEFEERAKELIKIVGLEDRINNKGSQLSGGQQQRVAIARALINNPDIILADEPIGNLDSKTGQAVMELLRDLNQKYKKTIVQVTHSLESSKYGKRTITIKDGEIVIERR